MLTVSGAANRFPDKCDSDPEGTRALNIEASRSLARATASRGIFLIYISTDYVFPGTEGDAPYEVTDTPKPPNLYGETKHDGEKAVLEEYKAAGKEGLGVVLRVPVLYGEADSPKESAVNVLMDAVNKAQEKDSNLTMDHWAIRYPTNTEDVGRVCSGMSSKLRFTHVSSPTLHSLTLDRHRNKVHLYNRQILSPSNSPILVRRQIHKIRNLRVVCGHNGVLPG